MIQVFELAVDSSVWGGAKKFASDVPKAITSWKGSQDYIGSKKMFAVSRPILADDTAAVPENTAHVRRNRDAT